MSILVTLQCKVCAYRAGKKENVQAHVKKVHSIQTGFADYVLVIQEELNKWKNMICVKLIELIEGRICLLFLLKKIWCQKINIIILYKRK